MKRYQLFPGCIVYDNFLEESDFTSLRRASNNLSFFNNSNPLWKQDTVHVKVSVPIIWTVDESLKSFLSKTGEFLLYPTTNILDKFIETVSTLCMEQKMYGQFQKDWLGFVMSIYIASQSNELLWHDDGAHYKGAFTYYLHDNWNDDWGGELLVTDQRRPSIGHFVSPKPNRIVFLQGGIPHCVKQLKEPATRRISISGFLVTPKYLKEHLPS